ncbi:MAG: hypothetical protein KatS3mg109_0718 [Pirellulaceae bacterium]|nr:MAG: hypothetical protein KatS3mg109_0718 [Pirellulaceae bacterium]GIW95506.1 MAG: hypothetical protein KatS3mg110_3547 [Pirellulaceae bacterium]
MEGLSALVVDDDPVARSMWSFALRQEGFACDTAEDGQQAHEMLRAKDYHLAVVDLRMPQRHGYELAMELLKQPGRPVVMIHTAIDDPLICQDLLRLGVDDVSQKPGNYPVLALRARVLVERKLRSDPQATPFLPRPPGLDPDYIERLCRVEVSCTSRATTRSGTNDPAAVVPPVAEEQLQEQLKKLTTVVPLSPAARDVVDLIEEGSHSAARIAAAAARDPSLTVEILRLANSSYYNPRGERIADLERAIVRIGLRRLLELAVATSTLAALTTHVLPWLDTSLLWQRSLAAGVASDLLTSSGQEDQVHPGLFLASVLHGLGRVALGALFTREYEQMLEHCRRTGAALPQLEKQVFGRTAGDVLVQLLEKWHLPAELCQVLRYEDVPFNQLGTVPGEILPAASLLKWSILLGQLATARWEPWEEIDLPSFAGDLLPVPLDGQELMALIDEIRQAARQLANFRHGVVSHGHRPATRSWQCRYHSLTADNPALRILMDSFGIRTVAGKESSNTAPLLIDALDNSEWSTGDETVVPDNVLYVVRETAKVPECLEGRCVRLPCSASAFQSQLRTWLEDSANRAVARGGPAPSDQSKQTGYVLSHKP